MRLVNLRNAAGEIVVSLPAERIVRLEPFHDACDVIYHDGNGEESHCVINRPVDHVADAIMAGAWDAAEPDLVAAARLVVSRWEGGDLAAAVRGLDAALRAGGR